MKQNDFFLLYSNCRVVEGSTYSAIYDLQSQCYYSISNEIKELIARLSKEPVSKILERYVGSKNQLLKILDNFVVNKIGFYTPYPELFPPLNIEVYDVYDFNNVCIDIDLDTSQYIEMLECLLPFIMQGLQIRLYNSDDNKLKLFFSYLETFFEKVNLFYCEVLLDNYRDLNTVISIEEDKFNHIGCIMEFSPTFDQSVNVIQLENQKRLIQVKSNSIQENKLKKKEISKNNFFVNMELFNEANFYNSFYYKKVYINTAGNISNSLNGESFGTLFDENLSEIISINGFKDIWFINKDKMEICRDCEFRYMCVDDRIPVKTKNGYKFESSCNYNPYKGIWI